MSQLAASSPRPGDRRSPVALRPLGPLAVTLYVLFAGWIALGGALVFARVEERTLISRAAEGETVSMADAVASDDQIAALNGAVILMLLVTGVVFVWWFRRGYGNLDGLDLTRRFTPGWAVGGWFVPIVGWWRPKQLADDLWQSVQRADRERGVVPRDRAVLAWWWGIYLALSIGDRAISTRDDVTFDDMMSANALSIGWAVAAAFGAVLAMLVVRAISEAQAELARRVDRPASNASES